MSSHAPVTSRDPKILILLPTPLGIKARAFYFNVYRTGFAFFLLNKSYSQIIIIPKKGYNVLWLIVVKSYQVLEQHES